MTLINHCLGLLLTAPVSRRAIVIDSWLSSVLKRRAYVYTAQERL